MMPTPAEDTKQNNIDWLQLKAREAEQLLQQKFFFEELTGLHHLHLFLEHYAFIVWEEMSLLQQISLLAEALDPNAPNSKRLRQVTGKMLLVAASDINVSGHNTDLLAVYRKGMDACGASSSNISTFEARLRRGEPAAQILRTLGVSSGVVQHVQHTQKLLTENHLNQQLAALCFAPRLPKPEALLHLLDQLDRKLPVLLLRMRYFFDLEMMLHQSLFGPLGQEALSLVCGTDQALWEECGTALTETTLSRAGVLSDARAAIKRGK